MFEELKRKIAHFIFRRKYLRKDGIPLLYNNIVSDAKNFFFLMPKLDNEFYHTLDILKYYLIHKKIITLFLPEHKYNLIPEKEKYRFISFSQKQINRFNLPDKNLIDRVREKEFDVVIDLNKAEDIFFSAIANVAQSKIRVSFKKDLSDNYYNLQIADKQNNPEASYRSFLNCLRMF